MLTGSVVLASAFVVRIAERAVREDKWPTWRHEFLLAMGLAALILLIGIVARRVLILTMPPSLRLPAKRPSRFLITKGLLIAGGLATLFVGWRVAFESTTPSLEASVGQCFSLGDQVTGIDRIPGVDCEEFHELEIIAILEYPAPAGAAFPGLEAQFTWAEPGCAAAIENGRSACPTDRGRDLRSRSSRRRSRTGASGAVRCGAW